MVEAIIALIGAIAAITPGIVKLILEAKTRALDEQAALRQRNIDELESGARRMRQQSSV